MQNLSSIDLTHLQMPYEIFREISSKAFERFNETLEKEACVKASLSIDMHTNKDTDEWIIKGVIDTLCDVQCVRCLHSVKLTLHCDIFMVIIKDGGNNLNNKRLDIRNDSDYWTVGSDGDFNIAELMDEQLLLEMPINPKHESLQYCKSLLEYGSEGDFSGELLNNNPFLDIKNYLK